MLHTCVQLFCNSKIVSDPGRSSKCATRGTRPPQPWPPIRFHNHGVAVRFQYTWDKCSKISCNRFGLKWSVITSKAKRAD